MADTVMTKTFVLRGPNQAKQLWAFLRANWTAMAQAGQPLAVQVMPHKAKRSTAQNRRLHAILTVIADNAWVEGRQYDAETWKDYFKAKYIGTTDGPDGSRFPISTTTLDVDEFSAFMDRIESHAIVELSIEPEAFL